MIQHEFHAEQVWHNLSLNRYFIHVNEVKRVLMPILEEVYQIGYDRGVSDQVNNLSVKPTVEEMTKFETDITYDGAETVG